MFDRRATSSCDSGLNDASSTTPSFTPCTVRVSEATTGSEITARVIRTVRVVPCAGRRVVDPAEEEEEEEEEETRRPVGSVRRACGRSIPSATSCPADP